MRLMLSLLTVSLAAGCAGFGVEIDSSADRRQTQMRDYAARRFECDRASVQIEERLSEERSDCVQWAPSEPPTEDHDDLIGQLGSPACLRWTTEVVSLRPGDRYVARGCGAEMEFRCDVCGATPASCVPDDITVTCATY